MAYIPFSFQVKSDKYDGHFMSDIYFFISEISFFIFDIKKIISNINSAGIGKYKSLIVNFEF